jgi:site-specific DNA-methyltransferase (adenine-specific)
MLKFNSIDKLFIGQSYSGVNSNDKRLKDTETKTTLKCYVSQRKGFEKHIDKSEIKKNRDFNKWKVITARAANGAKGGFGNMFLGKPDEIHTSSYISFNLNSENESKSFLSYLKCRLPNFILSLRKASQDISESTCKWIPLPPLNKEWTDEEVYKHFKLSEDDIKLINDTNIIGYKNIIKQTKWSVETPEKKVS